MTLTKKLSYVFFLNKFLIFKLQIFFFSSKNLPSFGHQKYRVRNMSRSLAALWRELGRRMNTLEKQLEAPINLQWPRQRWKLAWPIHRTISADLQAGSRIPVPFYIFHKTLLERASVRQSGWEPNLEFVWNDSRAENLGHQHFSILDLMSFGPNDIFQERRMRGQEWRVLLRVLEVDRSELSLRFQGSELCFQSPHHWTCSNGCRQHQCPPLSGSTKKTVMRILSDANF